MNCKFNKAWIGPCEKKTDGKDYCKDHEGLKCRSCGAQATHECDSTSGLVCGAPLCADCEHTLRENGCSSGAPLPEGLGEHCKRTEQVYKLWFHPDFKEKTDAI